MDKPRQTKWEPPRGITLLSFPQRPAQPYGVQWRVDGRRKTKTFKTREDQIKFARSLAGAAKKDGLAALRLDEGEVREWRAFRATIGEDADLDAVAACWLKHREVMLRAPLTVSQAVAAYTEAKKAEGVSAASIAHYGPIFDRLTEEVGEKDVGTITGETIAAFMARQSGAAHTVSTRFRRIRALFNWLAETKRVEGSPFTGMKPPKVPHKEVEILTVQQTADLFLKNATNKDGSPITSERRETLGRLALEAFAGLRNDTAAQIVADEIVDGGLRIPAAKIKTAKAQYLDGLPANLMAWLKWSRPEEWGMTVRQYAKAKADAFTWANVPHPHNALRHGFASYHVAAYKDPSKTSVILCHTAPKLLWNTYRGAATEADGRTYFEITPPITK